MNMPYIHLRAAYLAGTALAQSKLKIMPLGDSITEMTCWRAKTWDRLRAGNATGRVEFVGSMNNTQACDVADAEFASQHHEGHTGFLTIDIAYDGHAERWINATRPDVLTWMLGTDDVAGGRRVEDVVEAYTSIVATARSLNAGMRIVVQTVTPLPANDGPVEALNAMILDWAAGQSTAESPVYVNDIYPFPKNLLRDGIHPGDAGDDIIADSLSALLLQIINSEPAGNDTEPDS
ncbi:carbohydrate esterase family 3 protein [Hypoxylon sp. FL1284]|nr:carbohydrate esterase family 3 protein [Hypoxylon sp. FL1284]